MQLAYGCVCNCANMHGILSTKMYLVNNLNADEWNLDIIKLFM